jgi:hypothetical protein
MPAIAQRSSYSFIFFAMHKIKMNVGFLYLKTIKGGGTGVLIRMARVKWQRL